MSFLNYDFNKNSYFLILGQNNIFVNVLAVTTQKIRTKKILWKISPFIIKRSSEIKSYQFETLFSRTFFLAPVWFFT